MSHAYTATIAWARGEAVFTDNQYSRAHTWSFDGGVEVQASSSPLVVPRWSREDAVDPEEAFVASVASCHMLFFLGFAAGAKWVVDSYRDAASCVMTKNASGKLYVSRVTLDPVIVFGGEVRPSTAEIGALHARAHAECFIANSILGEVVVTGHDLPHG